MPKTLPSSSGAARAACLSVAAVATLAAALAAQGAQNLSLVAHVPGMPCATSDIHHIGGDYVLLARRSQGFAVVDVRNPQSPVVNHITPPGYPRGVSSYGVGDIKFDGRYIYATSEDFYFGNTGGVFIYDTVPDPMNPTLVNDYRPTELQGGVHNVWVDGNHMYCVSDGTYLIEVYDITNRLAPVRVSTLGTTVPSAWAHDVMTRNGRAYCSFLHGGFAIYDVTNPAAPVLLGRKTYANPFTHNAWPSADGRYLYTTDENSVQGVGGYVRIWDLQNMANIVQVGQYKAGAVDSIVHNVYVFGDLLYVAYYKEGLRICSLLPDPTNPVEIAHYDTFPGTQTPCFPAPAYAGCWGVKMLPSGLIAASDLDNGLFLLRPDLVTHTFGATPNPVAGGQTLHLSLGWGSNANGMLDGFGAIVVTGFQGIPLFSPLLIDGLRFAAPGSVSRAVPIAVPPGLPSGLTVDFTAWSGTASAFHLNQATLVRVTLQ